MRAFFSLFFISETFYIQGKGTQLILRITANCWPVNLGNPSHMKILLLVGLIVLNGLFAMSEIALVAAKNSRVALHAIEIMQDGLRQGGKADGIIEACTKMCGLFFSLFLSIFYI